MKSLYGRTKSCERGYKIYALTNNYFCNHICNRSATVLDFDSRHGGFAIATKFLQLLNQKSLRGIKPKSEKRTQGKTTGGRNGL